MNVFARRSALLWKQPTYQTRSPPSMQAGSQHLRIPFRRFTRTPPQGNHETLYQLMAPSGWTAQDQQEWLQDRNDSAIEARTQGKYSAWLITLFHDWFLRWPEREKLLGPDVDVLTPEQEAQLAAAIKRRQEQLRNWFHNNRHKRFSKNATGGAEAHVSSHAGPSTRAIRAKLTTGKATRAPQPREVFCRMFYDDEKKQVVAEELAAERELLGRTLTKSESMRISRGRIDALFQEASQDVKEQIQVRVAEVKAARQATPPPEDPKRERTPQEYQNAIDGAPKTITDLLSPVALETGWCFTVMGAGPSPRHGGAIKTFAVHFGTNATGHMLDEATQNYREKYVQPLVHFVKGVYPRDVRAKRALPASTYEDADEMMMLIPPRQEPPRSNPIPPSASALTVPTPSASTQPAPTHVPPLAAPALPPVPPSSLSENATGQDMASQGVLGDPVNMSMSFGSDWSIHMNGDGTGQNMFNMDGEMMDMGEWHTTAFASMTNATHSMPVPPIPIPPLTQDPLDLNVPLPSTYSLMSASVAPPPAPAPSSSTAPAPSSSTAPTPSSSTTPSPSSSTAPATSSSTAPATSSSTAPATSSSIPPATSSSTALAPSSSTITAPATSSSIAPAPVPAPSSSTALAPSSSTAPADRVAASLRGKSQQKPQQT
ncbi:hypothetical protein L227DRAFT_614710 [Lentinus tigrinus ALCF2SS1-6]|uniref:Homeobox domain-containing protein n=2 Tax=Lentinus tigrinus TaxID=5365 RepID=A0A5C2RYB1_9APHY|nr:hypothetical protein L227DRAFT_614710 [Lentinus tigrinus ALCF2SS1-6]